MVKEKWYYLCVLAWSFEIIRNDSVYWSLEVLFTLIKDFLEEVKKFCDNALALC